MKKILIPLGIWGLFETIAVTLWLVLDNIFYLFNFSYIGTCVALGMFLYLKNLKYARNIVQFAVGTYMLIYLGIISNENMQIEGFWYYLFLGVFEAATIHYAVAKIFGPIFFGRGWCGYACWTAMVLDILPYKIPQQPRKEFGFIRYIVFILSLLFVGTLFLLNITNLDKIMFWSFIIGNVLYYSIGITLAFAFKDNRAFCKYVCPITIFLKPASHFSLLRVKNDTTKCISCGKCKRVCPMNVDMINNSRKRINGTECILCFKCIEECPQKALHL
ncbi:MAG: 4Fe-4S binding protein [Anaerotignaceae bacterium]